MDYRPEYRLDRLRMMPGGSSSYGQREGEPLLQWLRTMVVDLSHTAEREERERLALQQRSAVDCAVERVVCKQLNADHLSHLLPFLLQCVLQLTSLDLRCCTTRRLDDAFYHSVVDVHRSSLQRLYLPGNSSVTQSTLDRFTQLEELDASGCDNLTNVDFCSATLRVLYANRCDNLTDAGLRKATGLEVLHVSDCPEVTDVSPFAHCLLELDASKDCGIGSAALSNCHQLQVLNAHSTNRIETLQPFAPRLRELHVGPNCVLNDADLADATGLVKLSLDHSAGITTVDPFGASLREIFVDGGELDDEGLVKATNLVTFSASGNRKIHRVAPFAKSLLVLALTGCRVGLEAVVADATNLIWLDVSLNDQVTTASLQQLCCRSLRHLVADGTFTSKTGPFPTATQLVTLQCRWNPNLTMNEPSLHSLEELVTDHEELFWDAVEWAPNLHCIKGGCFSDSDSENDSYRTVLEETGCRLKTDVLFVSYWFRNTGEEHLVCV